MIHTASGTTPLIAIDAVVLDTETTGLDTNKARLVQIGAVRLRNGIIATDETFDTLIDPGIPIPPATTAIHHIDDAMVVGAPTFPDVREKLREFIGSSIVIGHSIGFDLAMLRRECKLATLMFAVPRTLDTRLLAQIANPKLPDFSMEMIGKWLGVELSDRHTALGDAIATAKLFQALIPKLREGGIRTVAEAEKACRQLTEVLEEHQRAGWMEPVAPPSRADAERTLARLDSYPYRHRVRDVMSRTPAIIAAGTSLNDAMQQMVERRISSVFACERMPAEGAAPEAGKTGIITERDVLRAIALNGPGALVRPVGDFMSKPLAAIPEEAFIYRAVGRMSRLKVRHLGVTNERGELVGALSARDLLRLRASEAISLGDEIDEAASVPELGAAWAKLPMVARSLVEEDVGAREVAAVISREIGALVRKAATMAEARMETCGQGLPPVPYALLVLGSAGRGESLLSADQDTAIVYESGVPDGPEDRWFATFSAHVGDILNEVGLPYCRGGVMARNAEWRGSLQTWMERIDGWVRRSRPEDLLSVDIFFDLRVVHGDAGLGHKLLTEAYGRGHRAAGFAKLLAEIGDAYRPPVNFLGGFKTEFGRLDLKKGGLFPVVSAARVLAIRHNVVRRATKDRLDALRSMNIGGETDLARLNAAHELVLRLILRQQVADSVEGHPLSSSVRVRDLDRVEADELKAALTALGHAMELVRDLLFAR
ncbi:MAG: DUF294 nucleotidyltransferase-like domain-containing protein [Hyphomicrobiales bacterium]